MSLIQDAVAAMKEVLVLTEKVDQAGKLISEVSRDLRDHDRRLVRLETLVEVAKAQAPRLTK